MGAAWIWTKDITPCTRCGTSCDTEGACASGLNETEDGNLCDKCVATCAECGEEFTEFGRVLICECNREEYRAEYEAEHEAEGRAHRAEMRDGGW